MRKAFTLVEVLVVLAISALLTGVALTYNNASRNEIALVVESAKISQFILRAESLSIATYGKSAAASPVCGYGMKFDSAAQTYGIFEYHPNAAVGKSCREVPLPIATIDPATEMQPYTSGTWDIGVAPEVRIGSSTAPDSISVILFFPPTPTTYISLDGATFLSPTQTSKVYLRTANGNDSRTISVNPAGQVAL